MSRRVASRHVISCHVTSRHVTSRHLFSRHVLKTLKKQTGLRLSQNSLLGGLSHSAMLNAVNASCRVASCHVASRHAVSCPACHVASRRVISCIIMSCPVTSSVLVLHACRVASCHVMSRHVTSRHVMARCAVKRRHKNAAKQGKKTIFGQEVALRPSLRRRGKIRKEGVRSSDERGSARVASPHRRCFWHS